MFVAYSATDMLWIQANISVPWRVQPSRDPRDDIPKDSLHCVMSLIFKMFHNIYIYAIMKHYIYVYNYMPSIWKLLVVLIFKCKYAQLYAIPRISRAGNRYRSSMTFPLPKPPWRFFVAFPATFDYRVRYPNYIYIIIYTIEYTYMLCIVSIHILPNFRWNATVYTSLLTRVQCLSKIHHRIQFAWAVTPKYNKCAEMSPKGPPNTEFRTLVTAPWQPFVVVALTFLQIPWNAFIPIMIPLWHHFSRERLSGGFFQ